MRNNHKLFNIVTVELGVVYMLIKGQKTFWFSPIICVEKRQKIVEKSVDKLGKTCGNVN